MRDVTEDDWNAAIEKMLHMIRVRQANVPKFSGMYSSMEALARDAKALKRPALLPRRQTGRCTACGDTKRFTGDQ